MNTQITRWTPAKEMEQFQNRLASLWNWEPVRFNGEQALGVSEWNPRVDILEDDHEFAVKVELPEVKREDVNVTVENGVLTVSGGKIRTSTKSPSGATTVSMLVKAKPGQLKKLRKKGHLGVRVAITFVSDTGATTSTNTIVRLVRKR